MTVRVKKALARFFVRRPEKKDLEERNILHDAAPDDRKLRAKQLELRLSTRLSKSTLEQLQILQPESEAVSPPQSPSSPRKGSGVKRIRDKVNRKASQMRDYVHRKNTRRELTAHDDTELPKKESTPTLDAQSRRAKFKRKSRSMPAIVRSRKNNAYVFGGALPNMDMKNVACEGQLVTVPIIATVCVDYLMPKIEIEGIFRVSGNHADIERIKLQIDKTRQYQVIAQCDNPNTVAGIFKSFFRELAEPLMTFAHYDLLIAAATPDKNSNSNNEEAHVKRAEQLKSALTKLPKENYDLLLYLASFLVKVSQSSKVNLMDGRNLSLIWGSIVLRDQHEDVASLTALTNTAHQAAVMALLIEHFELIFKAKNSTTAPIKPVNNNTPPSSMSSTMNPGSVAPLTSTLTPMPPTVTPVNSGPLPSVVSSPAMLSITKPATSVNAAPVKTAVNGGPPAPAKSRGPLPAPPPRVKAGTLKTPVKTATVKFSSIDVANTNKPNNADTPMIEPAKNTPAAIPVLVAAYPVTMDKRGTVPDDGAHEEPKSEPMRLRSITTGNADKDTRVKVTQARAAATPVKRPAVPAVTPPSVGPKDSGLLSPPSSAPKKTGPKTPNVVSNAGPISSPLQIPPTTAGKTPPVPPPRAKLNPNPSPKEPRRSYSLQTLN